MQRRLAVILAVDLVDYTRIMEEDEARAISLVQELRNQSLEPSVISKGGEILKRMGDGWILSFNAVSDAIGSAFDVQTNLADHQLIRLRMGGHIGEIAEDEADFYGAGVNLASRLQTEAPPGGAMISEDLHRQLPKAMASEFVDAGSFKLKNIAVPIRGFQWRPEGIGKTESRNQIPAISIAAFKALPESDDNLAAVEDFREQLNLCLARRTGIRVLDGTAGADEQATYLLRGRLRHSSGGTRINLSLSTRIDQHNVWAEAYQSDSMDLFDFCDEVVERADADLRLQINAFDGDRIAELRDEDLSVSELRSRAAGYFYAGSLSDFERGIDLMDRALYLNPDDPMAMAMRVEGRVYSYQAQHLAMSKEVLDQCSEEANRAVELLPKSDYAFYARAYLDAVFGRTTVTALADANRCLELSPAYAPGMEVRASVHLRNDRRKQAIADFVKSIGFSKSDPFLPQRCYYLSIAHFVDGGYEAALETLSTAVQLQPNVRAYHRLRALTYRKLGQAEEAAAAEATAGKLSGEPHLYAPRPLLPAGYEDLITELAPDGYLRWDE